jgi:PEP-CTERM motif
MRRILAVLGSTLLGAFVLAPSALADTIGSPPVSAPNIDSAVGTSFAFLGSFASAGETVVSWSFFSGSPGNLITPLILAQTSPNVWQVTGIGTTQVAGSGLQSFSFGLVSGSDITGLNSTFGWFDGGNGSTNNGSIEYSCTSAYAGPCAGPAPVPGANSEWFNLGLAAPPVVGNSSGPDPTYGFLTRTYSVQFTATTAVPEPSALLLLGSGLTAVIGATRRKWLA